jgi:predicted nucleotidyltransferase component of viral defense system
MNPITKEIEKVLKILSGRMEGYYLTGGTALSLFYFHHRESYDLDFFTQELIKTRAEDIIQHLSESIGKKVSLISEEKRKNRGKILVYSYKTGKDTMKIDFVEDSYKLIRQPRIIDGIPVLEKEDIYLRKIFAACGSHAEINEIGGKRFKGGRQEAKDFFDLYYLSMTFIPLSKFAIKYCIPGQVESIVVWYRTYNRTAMKLALMDIITDKNIDFQKMERHFRDEIERMVIKGA